VRDIAPLLNQWDPSLVLLFHQFPALHLSLVDTCLSLNVRQEFDANLPKTSQNLLPGSQKAIRVRLCISANNQSGNVIHVKSNILETNRTAGKSRRENIRDAPIRNFRSDGRFVVTRAVAVRQFCLMSSID
jgi:hypothetical protein